MKPSSLRPAALILVLAGLGGRLEARTPQIIVAFKANGFEQTSATAQRVYEPGYGIEVDFGSSVPTGALVQLFGPNGTTLTLPRVSNISYYIEGYFADTASLNATLPDGTYSLIVTTSGVATSNTPLTIQGGSNFRPTLISNFDELQNWPGGTLQVNWNGFDGGTADDNGLLNIVRANGTTLYSSPGPGSSGTLTGLSRTASVSGLTTAPGETIYGHLYFLRFNVGLVGGRTAIASGAGYFLRFPITRAAPTKAVITSQPQTVAVALGSTAVVSVNASGIGLTYQWKKNGLPIAGATSSTYVVGNAQPATVGSFSVDVTNSAGTVSSTSAAITVVNTTDPGRLTNLSILTTLASAGDFFTLGYVVGNSSATAPLPLVIRAAGPGLGALGYPGVLADPRLELFAGLTKTTENDNWAGTSALKSGFTSVGAFPFANDASKDAAALANVTTRDNSARVSAADNGTGAVIAEIYDATPGGTFIAASPRLINVSVLKNIGTGLTAGFTIGGSTARTVLIRAVGPTLGVLGVPGGVADPKLELFSGQTKISENDDWAGDPALVTAFTSVGAFTLPTATKDAAIVATLAPGSYTARVTGVNNVTGSALVEIYEVP